jgi:hypothetical protein
MMITPMDASVLMQAALEADKQKDIGPLDADRPLTRLRMRLNQKIDVEQAVIESALSSLMEMDDIKKWKHPDGMTLDGFIQKITPWGSTYNRKYRLFEKGKK